MDSYKRVFEKSTTFALTPNPSVLSFFYSGGTPEEKRRSQAWERGAGTSGEGGVRARGLCLYKGDYRESRVDECHLILFKQPLRGRVKGLCSNSNRIEHKYVVDRFIQAIYLVRDRHSW
jgi:hypothetical protein